MVGLSGVEPKLTRSKRAVLPLHQRPILTKWCRRSDFHRQPPASMAIALNPANRLMPTHMLATSQVTETRIFGPVVELPRQNIKSSEEEILLFYILLGQPHDSIHHLKGDQ